MKKVLLGLLLLSTQLFAQEQGTIKGTIKDASTGEEIIGANIVVEGTTTGASSDVFGNYQFKIAAGTYTVVASYVSYKKFRKEQVVVTAGGVVNIDITLETDAEELEAVEIIGKADKTTENVLIAERRETELLVQNIGAQELKKVGASDAAEGLKKVVGLSIVGSKYIIVRGLTDRYNTGTLNGFTVASPNPDKRVLPYDIFPSGVIQNLNVVKSFTPDLYADFTGAAIDIKTKDYPEEPLLEISAGVSVNTQTTFKDFLSDPSTDNDFLGFNSDREIPGNLLSSEFSTLNTNSEEYNSSNFFSSKFTPNRQSAPINKSFGLTYGNFKELEGISPEAGIGFMISANVSDKYQFTDRKLRNINANGGNLINFDANQYEFSTTKFAQGNVYFRVNHNHKITANMLYSHLSENTVRETWGSYWDRFPDNVFTRRIAYNDYSIAVAQLSGDHNFNDRLNVNWGASLSKAASSEPDRRQITFLYDPENKETYSYSFNNFDRAENHRFFSELSDNEISAKASFSYAINPNEDDSDSPLTSVSGGIQFRNKTRDFANRRFLYVPDRSVFDQEYPTVDIYNVDEALSFENLNNDLYEVIEATQQSDTYQADLSVIAPYISFKHTLIPEKLQISAGLRVEIAKQGIDYKKQTDSQFTPIRREELNTEDLFPSLVVKYNLNKENILRFSASRTVSRPDFKEMTPFQYQLVFGSFTTVGNPELQNGYNYNVDVRFEKFFDKDGLISIGAFGKSLQDPIVSVIIPGGGIQQLSYINGESASVYGVELEAKKKLGFIAPELKNFTFNTNVSLLHSNINIGENSAAQTKNERPLIGASPYLINVDLNYGSYIGNAFANFSLAYNTFGKRIFSAGANGAGDLYQMPINTLNFTSQIVFGAREQWGLTLSAKNILNAKVRTEQELMDQINFTEVLGREELNSFQNGVNFSIGIRFKVL